MCVYIFCVLNPFFLNSIFQFRLETLFQFKFSIGCRLNGKHLPTEKKNVRRPNTQTHSYTYPVYQSSDHFLTLRLNDAKQQQHKSARTHTHAPIHLWSALFRPFAMYHERKHATPKINCISIFLYVGCCARLAHTHARARNSCPFVFSVHITSSIIVLVLTICHLFSEAHLFGFSNREL